MEVKPLLSFRSRTSVCNQLFELYPELASEDNPVWADILDRAQLVDGLINTMLASAGSHAQA